jgi:CubicO group peptidase (beta-lactamase class C family)
LNVAKRLREILDLGLGERVYVCASGAVQVRGGEPAVAAVGWNEAGRSGRRITRDTLFDLASITKVLFTATALARAVARRQASLDDRIAEALDDLPWDPGFRDVTLRDVLSHRAGFEAWVDLAKELRERPERWGPGLDDTKNRVYRRIASMRPTYPRGAETRYSDLGFILLGRYLERLSGSPLPELFEREVRRPLGLDQTTPDPRRDRPVLQIAATEEIPWRGGLVHGAVHDDNAYVLGGLAGHAGLFGTASDLLRFAMVWLEAIDGDSDYLPAGVAREFVKRLPTEKGGSRALGWDCPSAASSAGKLVSSAAFGHLGYTGTSLWVDPDRKAAVVLLTNRVHPTSKNEAIRAFRPRFHDAVWEVLDR